VGARVVAAVSIRVWVGIWRERRREDVNGLGLIEKTVMVGSRWRRCKWVGFD